MQADGAAQLRYVRDRRSRDQQTSPDLAAAAGVTERAAAAVIADLESP